jgi:CheY-like chemotaxis protein
VSGGRGLPAAARAHPIVDDAPAIRPTLRVPLPRSCSSTTTRPTFEPSSARSSRPGGYRTRGVDSGAGALRLAPLEHPALLLLDIYLADLDGYTVASRIRELPASASVPIIFTNGADAPGHRTLTFGLGAVYLRKPITAAQLQAMSRALEPSPG